MYLDRIKCEYCGRVNSADELECKSCGAALMEEPEAEELYTPRGFSYGSTSSEDDDVTLYST